MLQDRYNQFRHIDALEYASAWEACQGLGVPEIEAKLLRLNEQIKELETASKPVPSYLLAAYRGYEAAILFRTTPSVFNSPEPFVVKLDDRG